MLLNAISMIVMGQAPAPLVCPVMGNPVTKPAEVIEFNGARYGTCCAGCAAAFTADPAKVLKDPKVKGKTLGTFLFDPVTGNRLEIAKAAATADYEGLRYPFASEANKASFLLHAKALAAAPKKEALFCPVMGSDVASQSKASGYADHDGVRYYFCCGGCDVKFKANPASFVGAAKDKVSPAKATQIKTE